MEYVKAFIVGGIICILVQILMDNTKLQPGRIMVILVVSGAVLGALGIYEKIADFCRMRGNSSALRLWIFPVEGHERSHRPTRSPGAVLKADFTAAAVGTSAALIFSYLASLIFQPKIKK